MTVYNRLRMLRADRGITRQQLAEAVEVNPQTIGYLERGEYSPSLELALKFSDFFNLPIEAMFSTTPFPALDARQLTSTKDAS